VRQDLATSLLSREEEARALLISLIDIKDDVRKKLSKKNFNIFRTNYIKKSKEIIKFLKKKVNEDSFKFFIINLNSLKLIYMTELEKFYIWLANNVKGIDDVIYYFGYIFF
jgi:DNA-dependent RNA polymerase auxiliary subunit epsilon